MKNMTLNKLRKLSAFGCFLALLAPTHGVAQVAIHLKLIENNALELQFDLPPNCRRLHFKKTGNGAQKIRAQWQAQDACFTADGENLTAKQPACQIARFKVPSSYDKISGYPAAYPMAETVYSHTSNFQLEESCGSVTYHFAAPFIAFEGKQVHGHAELEAKPDYSFPVLLSPTKLQTNVGIISYIDPVLSTQTQARINEVGEKTIAYLKSALPKARFDMPIIAAAKVKSPGSTGYDGDAGNVLRLGLLNWPEQLDARHDKMLTTFVSHEFSHRFQLRDAVDIYPQSRLIHEGGAEFLRWTTALSLGWISHQEAAAELDEAIGKCFLGTEQAAWSTLSGQHIGSRQLEYRCGLAVYVFGLATRQNTQSAMHNFGEFYERLKLGNQLDFNDAIECGDQRNCRAKWLPELLGSKRPMQEIWREMLETSGLAKEVEATQAQTDLMIKKAFSLMMKDDCGEASYFETPDGLIIDDIKNCHQLRAEMKVSGVEGHKFFGNMQALPALMQACKARGKVNLSIEHAADLTLACKTKYQKISSFYAVDIEEVLKRLN
jgi:hypothetical protein